MLKAFYKQCNWLVYNNNKKEENQLKIQILKHIKTEKEL